jgi:hypothetical protein
VEALERGWSPDNIRGADAAREELDAIRKDPRASSRARWIREALGGPVTLPDGSKCAAAARLPTVDLGRRFLRHDRIPLQPGTPRLPEHVLGHIGYADRSVAAAAGIPTRALGLMRDRVHAEGLVYADLTSDLDNVPSHR